MRSRPLSQRETWSTRARSRSAGMLVILGCHLRIFRILAQARVGSTPRSGTGWTFRCTQCGRTVEDLFEEYAMLVKQACYPRYQYLVPRPSDALNTAVAFNV